MAHHAFVRWILVLFGVVFVLAAAPSYLTPLTPAMTILRETVEPERQGRVFGVVSIAPSGRRAMAAAGAASTGVDRSGADQSGAEIHRSGDAPVPPAS